MCRILWSLSDVFTAPSDIAQFGLGFFYFMSSTQLFTAVCYWQFAAAVLQLNECAYRQVISAENSGISQVLCLFLIIYFCIFKLDSIWLIFHRHWMITVYLFSYWLSHPPKPHTRALLTLCKMFDLPHFGCRTPENEACISEIWSRLRSIYSAPTPKFHHPMYRLEIIMFTNKQTHS